MKKLEYKHKVFIGLLVFFGIIAAANIHLIYSAIKSEDGLVEENYYHKGLHYQTVKDQQRMQEKLAWKVSFDFYEKEGENYKYKVEVKDKNDLALSDANVDLLFFRPTKAGFDKKIKLSEFEKGKYQTETTLPVQGIWDVYVGIEKGKYKWQKKQRIKI